MAGFVRLWQQDPRLIIFGVLLTFFSSFGQTFLLSLYVPELADLLDITEGKMGTVYAVATLGSAAILSYLGRYIDFVDLKRYILGVLVGYVLALLILAGAQHWALVVLGLLLLRLTGQGLMGHTAVTSMARYFTAMRGKAISMATLGFPAGEAVLPVAMALVIEALGWRYALLLSSGLLLVGVLPLSQWLLRGYPTAPPLKRRKKTKGEKEEKDVGLGYFLRKRVFWVIAPNVFLLGFVNTAVFFFQVVLGESKGWSTEWVAGSLAAFAASSALSMFIAGPLVDHFSAKRLFPLYFFPYVLGLLLLSSGTAHWIYPASLFLMGFSNGLGSTIKSALQAEMFGTSRLGSVRSLFTVLMVISTALGPLFFGQLMDLSLAIDHLLLGCALLIVIAVGQSFRIWRMKPVAED